MSPRDLAHRRRSLAPLTVVTAAAAVFAILTVLVRLQWPPLETADHGSAAHLNSLIAGHPMLVTAVGAVTWLGSDGVLWTVAGAAAIGLALRRRWRLAICCLYAGVAILVTGHARGWWRWLFLIPAVAMPILVAISRVYRGEHHPTDILGSLLFSALWLAALSVLVKPNADAPGRTRRGVFADQRRARSPRESMSRQ